VQQFLGDVYWGELDFLLADLPPGTGDVSISVAGFLPGAQMLVVTTPQEAARKVAERAGKMAGQVRQTVVGVVENMSYFVCPHCGERTNVFGEGGGKLAADTLGVPLLGEIPLMPELREGGDAGTPIVVSHPDSAAARALLDTASALATASRTRVRKPLKLMSTQGAEAGNGHGGNGHEGNGHEGHEHEGNGHEGHEHAHEQHEHAHHEH
jgi:ATP-binding protein involved in chromosome partitioning